MKTIYLTTEAELRRMIDRWLESREVIGPRKTVWDDVLLEPLENGAACEFDFELEAASPKEWVLPQRETLFAYEVGAGPTVHLPPEAAEQILFGIRSCDMSGLIRLDEAMTAAPADYYYLRRRRKTTCVVLACERVFEDHFCHLLKTGPSLESGYDWQLTRLGADYAVEVGSERGAELAETVKDLLRAAGAGAGTIGSPQAALEERHEAARRSGGKFADLGRVREVLATEDSRTGIWTDLASRCQACGGCSFVCPTCGCFSISDERTEGAGGCRQRQWDSCAFAGFTETAGGGADKNERKVARVHRRLYHKLSGATGERSVPACVGCGRCVGVCTGNSKLRDVLTGLAEKGER